MAGKTDAGYTAMKNILMSPKGAGLFILGAFTANRLVEKARNKAVIKSVVKLVEDTTDSVAKAIPDAK